MFTLFVVQKQIKKDNISCMSSISVGSWMEVEEANIQCTLRMKSFKLLNVLIVEMDVMLNLEISAVYEKL